MPDQPKIFTVVDFSIEEDGRVAFVEHVIAAFDSDHAERVFRNTNVSFNEAYITTDDCTAMRLHPGAQLFTKSSCAPPAAPIDQVSFQHWMHTALGTTPPSYRKLEK